MPNTRTVKKRGAKDSAELDSSVVKALAHPLRHKVLSRLNERVASPKELADEFGEPLNRVSYHVRTLESLGCIELVRTAQRRGALEHYYRARVRPFFSEDDWITLPASARRSIINQHLRRISGDVSAAAQAGGFDHDDVHVSWTPMDLDERGMRDLDRLLGQTLERAMRIHADSASRQIKKGEGGPPPLSTELVMMHFGRAPKSGRSRKAA